MRDTKGCLDIVFDPNRNYYGNSRKRPNRHCDWRDDTLLPGWYDTEAEYGKRLRRKISERSSAKTS